MESIQTFELGVAFLNTKICPVGAHDFSWGIPFSAIQFLDIAYNLFRILEITKANLEVSLIYENLS